MGAMIAGIRKFALNILTSGTYDEYQIEKRSRIIFQNAATLAGAVFIGAFGLIALASGNATLFAVNASISLLIFGNFAFVRATKNFAFGNYFDVIAIFAYFLYLLWSGGQDNSGYLWSMIYPLIAIFLLGAARGTFVSLCYAALMSVIVFVPGVGQAVFNPLFGVRIVGTYIFIWLFGIVYENVRSATQKRLTESNADLIIVTSELSAEKRQTDNILQNVEEGIFVLDRECRIGMAYSAHLERILERGNLGGLSFIEAIGPALDEKDRKAIIDYFDVYFSSAINPDLLAEINPLSETRCDFFLPDGSSKEKWLRFSFTRIKGPDGTEAALGVVRDVTSEVGLKRMLELEAREHRRVMESLFQIIHVDPGMMKEFIADTEEELDSINALLKEEDVETNTVLHALQQSIHAVKGNALALGLNEFGLRVHDFEDKVKERIEGGCEWRELLKLTLGLGELRNELEELKRLIGKILDFQEANRNLGLGDATLLEHSVIRLAYREAERKGYQVIVAMEGFDSANLPGQHRKLIKDSLVQLVRNSLAHGFEPSSERAARGKPSACRIEVSANQEGDRYVVRYRDDGRGLDLGRIRESAARMPEFAGKSFAPTELARLIFMPGFSTANSVDLGSGRGIGMSVIKQRVEKAGGRISVKSGAGKYFELVISLPIPRASAVA